MMAICMLFALLSIGIALFHICDSIIQKWKSWRSTIRFKRALKDIEIEYERKKTKKTGAKEKGMNNRPFLMSAVRCKRR